MKRHHLRDGAEPPQTYRLRPVARALLGVCLTATAFPGHALPTGAEISAGGGVIGHAGNTLTIQQTSPRLAINWQSFGIGTGESVVFRQPDAGAIALNRVLGQDPSAILGRLSANGQVFVLNPNGVLFGPGAQVDVGGIVASTLGLSDADFLAGRYTFANGGSAGSVVNRGTIRAADGGYVALIAPQVTNEGAIAARLGTVALGAGDQITLQLAGNALVGFSVDQAAVAALVANRQLIQADGGAVVLSARAKDALLATVVNNEGIVEARSVSVSNGVIRLEGGASGVVSAGGKLDASGANAGESGGSVTITGDKIALVDGAVVDASGQAGGGTVLVGGDYQGRNADVRNARRSNVAHGATLRADATVGGDGGKVIVWADEATQFHGTISARGGVSSGNGGFVEVSGKQYLGFHGDVDTSAAKGGFGTLLLDPTNISVVAGATPNPPNAADGLWSFGEDPGNQSIGAGAINTLLTANNLMLQATNDITVGAAIAYNGASDRVLTLQANNNITVSQAISTSGGRLGVVLNADADASGAGTVAINNAITTGGGILTATGQNVTANTTGTTISTAGAVGRAGGSVTLTASATGNVTIAKAITAAGGTAPAASNGLAGGGVAVTGGTVTVANVTTSGSAGVGAGARAGGSGGSITLDATGAAPTLTLGGNLDARGGGGVNGGVGGSGGAITALDPMILTGNRQVLSAGGAGGTPAGGVVQLGNVDSNLATTRRTFTVTAGNAAATLGNLGATNALGTVNVSALGITAGSVSTVGLTNAAGAGVTLNADTGALVVGAINTSGGARSTNGGGTNAGAVTLTGNSIAPGAITARGGNGLGANNIGGSGGAVQVNGSGTASTTTLTAAIDTRGGDSVGTGPGGAGGAVTLRTTDGGSIASTAASTISTSGGRGQSGRRRDRHGSRRGEHGGHGESSGRDQHRWRRRPAGRQRRAKRGHGVDHPGRDCDGRCDQRAGVRFHRGDGRRRARRRCQYRHSRPRSYRRGASVPPTYWRGRHARGEQHRAAPVAPFNQGGNVRLRGTAGGTIQSTAAATINTFGGRSQPGGSVTVTTNPAADTLATVNLQGAITTNGGDGAPNAAGSAGGAVAISNAETITVGPMTTRGGGAGGGNLAGGAGGAITIYARDLASTAATLPVDRPDRLDPHARRRQRGHRHRWYWRARASTDFRRRRCVEHRRGDRRDDGGAGTSGRRVHGDGHCCRGHPRNSDGNGCSLYGRGRDIQEYEQAVTFSKENCRWTIQGDASEVRRTDERGTWMCC